MDGWMFFFFGTVGSLLAAGLGRAQPDEGGSWGAVDFLIIAVRECFFVRFQPRNCTSDSSEVPFPWSGHSRIDKPCTAAAACFLFCSSLAF